MCWIKRIILLLLILCCTVAGLVFSLRNQVAVPLDLIAFTLPPISIAILLLVTLILGVLLGWLILIPRTVVHQAHLMKVERQLKVSQDALHALRSQPSQPEGKSL